MDNSSSLESIKSKFDDSLHDVPDCNDFDNIWQETVEDKISKVTNLATATVTGCSSVSSECISNQKEALLKIETDLTKDNFEKDQDSTIKNKELDIEEELEESKASILSDCVDQDCQDKSENYPRETVRNASRLKRRLLKPPKEKKVDLLKCNKCNFQTTQRNNLNIHLLRHINSKDVQKLKCDHCSYKTNFVAFLNRHVRRHRNQKRNVAFKCDKCDFQTKHKNTLTTHQLQHNNSNELEMFKAKKYDFQTIFEQSIGLNLL